MQIHELNNYAGNLDSSAFVAVDNGSDTGKATVPRILQAATDEIAAANARIDNIIAGGDAPSVAEVTDARLGDDGIDYKSLGSAIRTQVGNLKTEIDDIVHSKSLFKSKSVPVFGSGSYVYINALTVTDVDSVGYTMSVGSIVNATAANPVMVKQYDANDSLLNTVNIQANTSKYIKPLSNTGWIIPPSIGISRFLTSRKDFS